MIINADSNSNKIKKDNKGKRIKFPFLLKNSQKNSKSGIIIAVICVFLVLFGVLMVYSASFYYAERTYNNKFFFLIKQAIGFFIGLFMLLILRNIDYNKLRKFGNIAMIISIVLLLLVFIPGLGVENYGARRWINLPGFTIQPSEIAKFAFVLFSSGYLAKNYKEIKSFKKLLPILIAGCTLCLLIIIEPNMSITMCVGLLMLTMLFIGGVSFKHFMLLCLPIIALVPILIIIEPYRLARLLAFINPWANPKGEGYQLIQSFFSISNGGLFGVGLFNSRQKYLFLPFAESDFIFAVIAEEFGLIGCLILLSLYLTIIICGIKIALRAKNRFGCYLASGIISVITIQTVLNVAVVTGLIPPTGLPLPFISSGSTSIVVFMSAIGVLLNIDRQNNNSVASKIDYNYSFSFLKKKRKQTF